MMTTANYDMTIDDDDLPPDEDASGSGDVDVPGEAQTATAGEAPPSPDTEPIHQAPEADASAFLPQYSAEVPADAAQQIAALKGEEREAFKRLMDGDTDMDSDAYSAIRERTDAAIQDLNVKTLTASIFQQANQQAADQLARTEWARSEAKMMAEFKADGLDYKAAPEKLVIFNRFLKTLGADRANEDKDATWFLSEAHRSAKAYLGIASKAAASSAVAQTRGVDKSLIPPTLSRVPPAANASIAANEFAHLDSLRGTARQRAIAKLTPEQEDRWLSSAGA